MKKRKTEAIATKRHRNRGKINLPSKEKRNYESNIRDDTDLN